MQIVDCFAAAAEVLPHLKQGAFLTVKTKDNKLNVMTIGWAMIGVHWSVPVLMVAVRPSRYTYSLLENAEDFTVTFPKIDMANELSCCGSKSGRDLDKFTLCNLGTELAQKSKTPIIKVPGIFYECKIVNSTMLDNKTLDKEIIQDYYSDSSYHKMYFGKILTCYRK